MGLGESMRIERSQTYARHAAHCALEDLRGQSEDFEEALAEGCRRARERGEPVEAHALEEAMALRAPSPFSAPWSKGAEAAEHTDIALDAALAASDAAHAGAEEEEARQALTTDPIEQALEEALAHARNPARAMAQAERTLRTGGEPETGHAPLDAAITANTWACDAQRLEDTADAARAAETTARALDAEPDAAEARAIRAAARGERSPTSALARAASARADVSACLDTPPRSALALARVTSLRAKGARARADAEQSVRYARAAERGGVVFEDGALDAAAGRLEAKPDALEGVPSETLRAALAPLGETGAGATPRADCARALDAAARAEEQAQARKRARTRKRSDGRMR